MFDLLLVILLNVLLVFWGPSNQVSLHRVLKYRLGHALSQFYLVYRSNQKSKNWVLFPVISKTNFTEFFNGNRKLKPIFVLHFNSVEFHLKFSACRSKLMENYICMTVKILIKSNNQLLMHPSYSMNILKFKKKTFFNCIFTYLKEN